MDVGRFGTIVLFAGIVVGLLGGGVLGVSACPGQDLQMRIVLDGMPMRDLTDERGTACRKLGDAMELSFSALNDPDPALADDEIFFQLDLSLTGLSGLPIGEPIEVERERRIEASAVVFCFCAEPLEALTTVEGTLTIESLGEETITGVTNVVFTDPDDRNTAVRRSVRFEVAFEDLAIAGNCSE